MLTTVTYPAARRCVINRMFPGRPPHEIRAKSALPGNGDRFPGQDPAAGRLLVVDDVHHGVDQGQVGERLREVALVPAGAGVDLLRVEQQRAGVRQHLFAQVPRLSLLADLGQGGD